jgi:hypothetical protein
MGKGLGDVIALNLKLGRRKNMAQSITLDKYQRQWAPDGKHFQKMGKPTRWEKAWDWLAADTDVALQRALNPSARFRIVNQKSGRIIGDESKT